VKPGVIEFIGALTNIGNNALDHLDLEEWFSSNEIPNHFVFIKKLSIGEDVINRFASNLKGHTVAALFMVKITIFACKIALFSKHKSNVLAGGFHDPLGHYLNQCKAILDISGHFSDSNSRQLIATPRSHHP